MCFSGHGTLVVFLSEQELSTFSVVVATLLPFWATALVGGWSNGSTGCTAHEIWIMTGVRT